MGDRHTAVKFFNQAAQAINDKSNPQNPTTAYQLFVSAAYADPSWWMAQYYCGNSVADFGHHAAAVACYRRALQCEIEPNDKAKVCANLCDRLHKLGRVSEALSYGELAVAIDPKSIVGWINLAICYGTLRDPKKALDAAQHAYDLDPDDVLAQMQLAFCLLFDRQYEKGFDVFEARYRYALHSFTQYPYPKWRGEPDCTLMLVADQGMGDTLDFARFIPAALKRVKYAHVTVHRELLRVFQQAFIGHENINIIPLGIQPAFAPADFYTSMVSLPWSMGLKQDEIVNTPQIKLPGSGVATMHQQAWKVKEAKFHVGIAWSGSTLNQINQYRSIPITSFLELARVPGVQLYSLQVNSNHSGAAKDIHDQGCVETIRDLAPHISDVSDTVSFLEHLDLVIACESALPHICAATGTEVWVPYSYLGRDYRLGHSGEIKLWCPTHRIFLQHEGETWDHVFERIVPALQEKVHGIDRAAGSEAA